MSTERVMVQDALPATSVRSDALQSSTVASEVPRRSRLRKDSPA
jgi:hypothetical protein